MASPPTHLGPSFLPSLTTSNPTLSSTDGPSLQICPLHLPHWQQRNPSQNPQWFHSSSWDATSNCHCILPKSLSPCPVTSSRHSWHPASPTASLSSLGPSYMLYLLPGIFSHLQPLLSYLHLVNSSWSFRSHVKCHFLRGQPWPVNPHQLLRGHPSSLIIYPQRPGNRSQHPTPASHPGRGCNSSARPQGPGQSLLPHGNCHQASDSTGKNATQVTQQNIRVYLITKRMLSKSLVVINCNSVPPHPIPKIFRNNNERLSTPSELKTLNTNSRHLVWSPTVRLYFIRAFPLSFSI